MFFHSLGSPTTKVAGARRSHRATRPSAKITDPDNTASSSKRKAASDVHASTTRRRHVSSPVTSDAEQDTDPAPASELVDTEIEDTVADEHEVGKHNEDGGVNGDGDEAVEDRYLETKAMAESDRQVSVSSAAITVMTDLSFRNARSRIAPRMIAPPMCVRSSFGRRIVSTRTRARRRMDTGAVSAGQSISISHSPSAHPLIRSSAAGNQVYTGARLFSQGGSPPSTLTFEGTPGLRLRLYVTIRSDDQLGHRIPGHFKVYKKRCLERNIPMHDRAIPDAEPESKMKQGTLDSAITREARIPAFSTKGLLDYIIELIVCEDKVRPSFITVHTAYHPNRHSN